jgi:hypothetical protein
MQGCLLVIVFSPQQLLHPTHASFSECEINEASNHVGFARPCGAVQRGVALLVFLEEEVLRFPDDNLVFLVFLEEEGSWS